MDMFDQNSFFYQIFHPSLPRLGPGDNASTRKALETLLPQGQELDKLKIIDLGCGTGVQTVELARLTKASILALDNHLPCLEELNRRAQKAGVAGNIRTLHRDMATMGPEDGPFDLVWSEGALFVMGFLNGIALGHSLLNPGGSMAATELAWLRPDVPSPCREFFDKIYPSMMDAQGNLEAISKTGFEIAGHFTLPKYAWWECFYVPLQERVRTLRKAHPEQLEMIETIQEEIDNYEKYSDYFGYEFFLMRKP